MPPLHRIFIANGENRASINLDAFPVQRIFFVAMRPESIEIKNSGTRSETGGFNLTIVVPAYNEAENLSDAIQMISSGLPVSLADHEIIIIDDGSRDDTAAIIRAITASSNKIRAIFHNANHGKGAALKSGFNAAIMEWVLFTDADLQIDISELSAFLKHTASHDIIIGYRQDRKDPFSRIFFSGIYTAIIRLSLGFRFRDLNCPFKLIRKSFLDSCNFQSKGFFIDAEIMHAAHVKKARIKELGVACKPRQKGESTVKFRHVIETVKELFALIARKNSDVR